MPVSLGICKGLKLTDGGALLVEPVKGNDSFDHLKDKQTFIPVSVLDEEMNECAEFEKGEVWVRTWWAEKEGFA